MSLMKIVVVSKSDSTGGAAVVSRRLTEALREQGQRAGMLVVEKKSNLPYVVEARYPLRKSMAFMEERAQIFLNNGFSKKNLWKADTGAFGLPLWEHPMIMEADAIILNWVNQGMLSLDGISRICMPGKRIIWTMHDMWNLTGVCHHAMDCRRFTEDCRGGKECVCRSLAHKVWGRKRRLYDATDITFVAVSNWLAERARESSLLKGRDIEVIPNPFQLVEIDRKRSGQRPTVLFAAAGLDNWIKGLSTFKKAIELLSGKLPEKARPEILLMGGVKDESSLEGFALPTTYLGIITGERDLAEAYSRADVIVNSSFFENLPGTLIEGQAYGAIPVSFDRGGQRDIIEHLSTGYLAPWSDDEGERAANLAEGIGKALNMVKTEGDTVRKRMLANVERFSYHTIGSRYLELLSRPPV